MKQGKLFDIFTRAQKTNNDILSLKEMLKDALHNSQAYQTALTSMEEAKEKLKEIKQDIILESFQKDSDRLEVLKNDKNNDVMLLSDCALSILMKGEMLEDIEIDGIVYEPIPIVKYKKK